MDYTTLGGNKELKVSRVGMGLWQASNAWNADEDGVIEAVGEAKKNGINFVDTAEQYGNGNSEK